MIATFSFVVHSSKYALLFLAALVYDEVQISPMSAHEGHLVVEASDSMIDDDGQVVVDELVNDDLNVVEIYGKYPDLQGDACLFDDSVVVVAVGVARSPVVWAVVLEIPVEEVLYVQYAVAVVVTRSVSPCINYLVL